MPGSRRRLRATIRFVEEFASSATISHAGQHIFGRDARTPRFGTCLAIDFDVYLIDESRDRRRRVFAGAARALSRVCVAPTSILRHQHARRSGHIATEARSSPVAGWSCSDDIASAFERYRRMLQERRRETRRSDPRLSIAAPLAPAAEHPVAATVRRPRPGTR